MLVRYGYAGLLQPVNRDGSSIFKLGSTVPLKLDLTDADGRDVTEGVVKVEMEKITSSIDGERVEETVTATPTNGRTFTYLDGHYQFNLATKPLSAGTWRVLAVVRRRDRAPHEDLAAVGSRGLPIGEGESAC